MILPDVHFPSWQTEIKILLFNNQDKITSDISLLLTTDEVTI
jgi:hypothetical protein